MTYYDGLIIIFLLAVFLIYFMKTGRIVPCDKLEKEFH